FFSSRRRHTRFSRDWSSDVCSSDLAPWMVGRFSTLDAVIDTVTGREDDLRDAIVKIGKLAAFAAEHAPAAPAPAAGTPSSSGGRSEERRVGKEACWWRVYRCHDLQI